MAIGRRLTQFTNATALDMALEIFGAGTLVVDARSAGAPVSGVLSGGRIAAEAAQRGRGVILSTARPAEESRTGGAILEVDFIPTGNVMTLQVRLGSGEDPDLAIPDLTNAFAIRMNGSRVPAPAVTVTRSDDSRLKPNGPPCQPIASDGFDTGINVSLSVTMPVNAGVENTLRIGIAGGGTIRLAAGSAQAVLIAPDGAIPVGDEPTVTPDMLARHASGGVMQVTHVNGEELHPTRPVTLNSGHVATRLASGDLEITPPAGRGGPTMPGPVTGKDNAAGHGITDTAFVVVTAMPRHAGAHGVAG